MAAMNFNPKKEKGQALTELAVSLVFLLLLLGGTIDLGRAFFMYIALRDATQEGAIYGSYCPWDKANIINRVKNSANGTWINSQMVQITDADIATIPDSSPGSAITVHAFVTFDITMPLLGGFVGTQSLPISTTISNTILKSTANCTN
jgi:hypothetical protein